ncbi:MAG TPA: hypothetical protein VGL59_13375 [Polyangia bacterium]
MHSVLPFLASLGLMVAASGCAPTPPPSSGSGSGGSSSSGGSSGSGSGGSNATGGSNGSGGSSVGTGGSGSGGADGADAGTGGTVVEGTGGSTASGTGGIMFNPQLPLPLIVTTVFNNQGWFGDAAEMTAFVPGSTLISQTVSAAGPCATRVANAQGNCLKVVFTPPTNITPLTTNAYVGVFLLTTVKAAHPAATPPEAIGDPNWGMVEPGANIAPGATKISFSVATDTPGLKVSFKAGAGDIFTVPETVMMPTSTWSTGSLSLTGLDYGMSVVGGFAWVLTDTTKAATFYLDNIVWTM